MSVPITEFQMTNGEQQRTESSNEKDIFHLKCLKRHLKDKHKYPTYF